MSIRVIPFLIFISERLFLSLAIVALFVLVPHLNLGLVSYRSFD